MGEATDEGDASRHADTFAPADDSAAGDRGSEIVDPEVERRLVAEAVELDPDRHAGRHVHQADDRPGGDDPALGDSDKLLAIIEAELDPVGPVADIGDSERPAMAHPARIGGEKLGVETLRVRTGAAHPFSRAAVSRIRAIMLGMPCVRFELSWFLRSNGASAPSMSVASISAGVRSWTASNTSATIPLVIAALLSARKWSRPSAPEVG